VYLIARGFVFARGHSSFAVAVRTSLRSPQRCESSGGADQLLDNAGMVGSLPGVVNDHEFGAWPPTP
jgi:hypothetical protein